MRADKSSARLALFLPKLEDGGAERVMLQLGTSFSERGYLVDLVLAVPGGRLESQVPTGVRLVDLGAPRAIRALPALARYLTKERPQALLSTLEHSNILAVWAGGLSRTRTRIVLREANVLLPRDQMHGWKPHVLRALMRQFYRSASVVVAVSQSVADSLIAGLGIPRQQVRTIYNPVVTADLAAKAAAPLDEPWLQPGAPPVVLGVGRLASQKDFATLVRAFAKVRAQRPARLLILGEGDERAALESLANQLGVGSDVRLLGYDHNPFRYMHRASIFALSSIFEGLPNALIQAMACGCRVISTDCPGGSREILNAGSLGPLVPMGDAVALARGILDLLEEADRNPVRIEYPVERFTERKAIDDYLEVLRVG